MLSSTIPSLLLPLAYRLTERNTSMTFGTQRYTTEPPIFGSSIFGSTHTAITASSNVDNEKSRPLVRVFSYGDKSHRSIHL
ncbi:hypothetical protein ABKN59_009930 [Abortiporus biennis]